MVNAEILANPRRVGGTGGRIGRNNLAEYGFEFATGMKEFIEREKH